jgi:hypothetical protein
MKSLQNVRTRRQLFRVTAVSAASIPFLVLIPILFGAAGVLPAAADIIYDVNRTVELGSVTGTITTDGTIGTLATNNIASWNLTLNGPGASPFNLTNLNSGVQVTGNDLSATATNLSFNFSGPSGFLLFQLGAPPFGNSQSYYCDATDASICLIGETVAPTGSFTAGFENNPTISGVQIIGTSSAFSKFESYQAALSSLWVQV